MARKKEKAKPISYVRFDFIDALENVCNEAMLTVQTLNTLVKLADMSPDVKKALQERCDALQAALIGDE